MQRPVRLPLQVGTSALWSYARFASTLIPGFLLLAAVPLLAPAMIQGGTRIDFGGIVVMLLVGLGLIVFALKHLWLSFALRPSDVLITREGLRFEGGRHRSKPIPWAEIDASQTSVQEEETMRPTLGWILLTAMMVALSLASRRLDFGSFKRPKVTVWRLHLAHRRRGVFVAAEAESAVERESLEALLASIQGMCAPVPTTPPEHAPNVLACHGCGAAAPPADAPAVQCAYCGTQIAMPEELRARIRAAQQIAHSQAKTSRHIGRLLGQPGATPTNVLFLLGAMPMAVAWPLVCAIGFYQWRQDALGLGTTLPLFVFPLAIIAAMFVLVRFRLVNRQALRLVTLGFAARGPQRPGDPYTCRRCGGALPAAANATALVQRCVFCNTENVLGIDLRGQAGAHVEEAQSLEQALAARTKQRLLWGLMLPVAAVLLCLGGGLLWQALRTPDTVGAQYRVWCDAGYAPYCDTLAQMYETGTGVTLDEERAAQFWSKGCTLGSARACHSFATYCRTGRGGVSIDLARAMQLDGWACSAGLPEACAMVPR